MDHRWGLLTPQHAGQVPEPPSHCFASAHNPACPLHHGMPQLRPKERKQRNQRPTPSHLRPVPPHTPCSAPSAKELAESKQHTKPHCRSTGQPRHTARLTGATGMVLVTITSSNTPLLSRSIAGGENTACDAHAYTSRAPSARSTCGGTRAVKGGVLRP